MAEIGLMGAMLVKCVIRTDWRFCTPLAACATKLCGKGIATRARIFLFFVSGRMLTTHSDNTRTRIFVVYTGLIEYFDDSDSEIVGTFLQQPLDSLSGFSDNLDH